MNRFRQILLLQALFLILIAGFAVNVSAAGGTISEFRQTGGSEDTIELKWNSYPGAVFYVVGYYDDSKVQGMEHTESNSITLKVSKDSHYKCFVDAYNRVGDTRIATSEYLDIYTVPGQMTGWKATSWSKDGKSGTVKWNQQQYRYVDGYEWRIYKSGKLKKSGTSTKMGFKVKLPSTSIYTLKVRGYIGINKKKDPDAKLYGQWSSQVIVPQPLLKSGSWNEDNKSVTLKWRKVKGAVKYIVYGSTKKKSGYKKIASLSKKRSSYTVKKVKGKALVPNRKYYLYVVAYYKKGSTKIKSAHTILWSGMANP